MNGSTPTAAVIVRRRSIAVLAAAVFATTLPVFAADAAADAAPTAAQLALGQRLYREGLRASGQAVQAVGAAQVRLAGKDAACAACHRRSGHGGSEGRFAIRPITGPALRQENSTAVHSPRIKAQLGVNVRPPYDEALLARAIRTGVDAAGKPLDPLMPRYVLDAAEMKALSAYLFALSAQASPGVDEQDIHFATVIQPDVTPERRRAMLEVMQAFVKDKTAGARSEEQRREAGTMRMYRAYRKWQLHVWELTGPDETWGAQLEAFYRERPVFALIGGLGGASWRPIHEFSERFEVPGVFPQAGLPMLGGTNQYTVYFSRGVTLEAEVLAKYLRDQGAPGRVLQVYRRDEAGTTAAAAFRNALQAGAGAAPDDLVVDGPAEPSWWRQVAAANPAAVVLWLGAADLAGLDAAGEAGPWPVYLSSSLLEGRRPQAAVRAGANVRLVTASDLPPRRDARLLRNRLWLHNRGLPAAAEDVQIDTLFALAVVSDIVGHIADSFSRDLFVERVEHAVAQTPMPSTYLQPSLGPGQRFAAKGASVVQLLDTDKPAARALSGWIVP